ncbi:MAG: 2-C-methyl-D-erythritol 2,4-cyclodiphosphate synthase [Pseudomonadota bacterium]
MRIGHGYDVHAFCDGDSIVLGGCRIPHHSGLKAHSDGDVLCHAVCDALLGSVALGDIGEHFPDTDAQWRDANSRELLRGVHELLIADGYAVVNIDATIIAQAPKLSAYKNAMVDHIAQDLGVARSQVNIKATTTERLGFVGREEGIAVYAVCLVERVHGA